jgi:outer membrane receptor for ferrienterochelin and colicins
MIAKFVLMALLAVPGSVLAQAPAPSPPAAASEDDEAAQLMAILTEETAVATRTRMNGDFVPGIVTVLHGDELEALGVETVWEALSLVPGTQAVRDADGTPSVVMRGIDFPFNSGNVKVLLNSVPLSRESAGINGIVLLTPVALVDRIEVIRGPGSVVYGDFAFMGLVNIVTRQQGGRVYVRGGGNEALSAGGYAAATVAGWDLALSAAGWTSQDAPLAAPRTAEEDRGFAALLLRRGGFSFTTEGTTRDLRQTSATTGTAAPLAVEQTHWTVEARYQRAWSATLRSELRASWLDNRFVAQNSRFEGDVADSGLELQWDGWRRHSWLAAAGYSRGEIGEASFRVPPPPPIPGAPPRPAPPPLALSGEKRDAVHVTLQDRFDLSPAFSLTGGVRFDHYSDLEEGRFTPRLSLVWRASDRHILKLQHAEGFRAPTFFELYAPGSRLPELGFEINATSELNYVYRRPRTVARATLFRTKIRDMIFVRRAGLFDNDHEARAHGFELEWEQQLAPSLKLQANLSAVDEEDDRNAAGITRPTPPSADWLANLALAWRITPRAFLTARWNHVGERHASREPRGYDLADVGFTWQDVWQEGLQLRAGVKNVLDSDLRYILSNPMGDNAVQFPGRTFWVQAAFAR